MLPIGNLAPTDLQDGAGGNVGTSVHKSAFKTMSVFSHIYSTYARPTALLKKLYTVFKGDLLMLALNIFFGILSKF